MSWYSCGRSLDPCYLDVFLASIYPTGLFLCQHISASYCDFSAHFEIMTRGMHSFYYYFKD